MTPSPFRFLVPVAAAALGAFPCLPAPSARAGDPPAKPAPLDADLDSEATVKREALSDPRNLRRDAFPVIREPKYLAVTDTRNMTADEWILGVTVGNSTLAFPVNVLNHHEIVVDLVDDVPLLVTWCPLCRTGSAFRRDLDGETLDFGHSGYLYRSNFLLYDRSVNSLWTSAEGRALTGRLRGKRLTRLPTVFLRWEAWKAAFPDSRVLAKDPENPDHGKDVYDARNGELKLTFGLGVLAGDEQKLYEFTELERTPVVADTVGGVPVLVAHHGPSKSTRAWERTLEGTVLDLRRAPDGEDGRFLLETVGQGRSTFDGITGEAVDGPLKGKHLVPVLSSHWEVYAWMAHHPRGTTYRASVPPAPHLPEVPK